MRLKTLTGARLLPLLGLLAVLGLASPARAQTVTLQSLLAGGTLTSGPLTFANFRDFTATGTGGANIVDPSQVFVTTIQDGVNFGLQFNSTAFFVGANQTQDTLFTYDVFATAGGNIILDNILSIDGFGTAGNGLILVGESRRDENNNPVPDNQTPPRTSKLVSSNPAITGVQDTAFFATPQNFLTISKDIALRGNGGAAFLSDFDQTFSIPEPGTLALVGLSVFGLGGYAWRRRKPAAV